MEKLLCLCVILLRPELSIRDTDLKERSSGDENEALHEYNIPGYLTLLVETRFLKIKSK